MHVTVIGAGVVGCAVAFELSTRGAQVRLVDPRGCGMGASRASAGMLAPYLEGHFDALRALAVRSLELYDDFVARAMARSGRRIEYRRTGTLQVAFTAEEVRQLEEDRESLEHRSVEHRILDAAAARRLEPLLASTIRAGLLVPSHGYVGVASLITALADALASSGVELSGAEVRSVSSQTGSARVETSEGALVSDAVVLAAGSWSGGIPMPPAPNAPVRPVRGQLLQLKFERPPLGRVVWGAGGYVVPWQDGHLLVGATVEDVGFDESVTPSGVETLLARAVALVPGAVDARCEGARAGLRPATPDELPIIGASSALPGVYYATGHYRNGVLLAPLTAAIIADLVVDGRERDDAVLVSPGRLAL